MQRRVAIIGGGISGLAASNRVRELAPDVRITLFESRFRLGGVIQTTRQEGFVIEAAADNFITTNPSAIQLCQRLGLQDELVPTNPGGCGAMVLGRGKLHPIPPGFLVMAPSRLWPMVTTGVLSPWGKLRAGMEWFARPRRGEPGDESLASFTCRHFGRETFERLVQPLVGGIYTADPCRLSLAATMPRFQQMEREHGSLIRAMIRQRRERHADQRTEQGGARYSQFMTLRGGMSTLIRTLADALPDGTIRLGSSVRRVTPNRNGGWSVDVDGSDQSWEQFDGLIIACPAPHASSMLAACDPRLAEELGEIEYSSCAVVSLAYRRDQIRHPLNSFGFVVPLRENRMILSCSFSSLKYPGRAPSDTVLMRVFIGGACQSGLLRLPKSQLIELADREIRELLQVQGRPMLQEIAVQTRSMPQYCVGHCQRVERIERLLRPYPTLALAGNSLNGVGVPGCIESGEIAAARVLEGIRTIEPSHHEAVCS